MQSVKRIGIMGGTFDPIHIGHLVTAEEARTQFELDEVIFVPSGIPPHKKYPVTSGEHRYLMTSMAVMSNPKFSMSPVEIDRLGNSYTIDTVKYFRKIYGSQVELYFITGADAIFEILTWKNVESLMEQCYFIAATRPGFNLQEIDNKLNFLPLNLKERVFNMEIPALAISSTDIRKRIALGKTIKYLVPEEIENYLYENRLYI